MKCLNFLTAIVYHSVQEAAPLGGNLKEMCTNLGFSSSSLASLPWGGVPTKWKKSSTEVQPFSFDTRDKDKMQRKQEKIQKVRSLYLYCKLYKTTWLLIY